MFVLAKAERMDHRIKEIVVGKGYDLFPGFSMFRLFFAMFKVLFFTFCV